MAKQKAKPERKRRRWVLWLILVLVLAVIGGGAFFALRRGEERSGVLEQAVRAFQRGDREVAERQFREVLSSQPDNEIARRLLLQILFDADRNEEGEEVALEWLELAPDNERALRYGTEFSLRRLKIQKAMEFAEKLAGRDPLFVQLTRVRVNDIMGTFNSRLESAGAAASVAEIHSDADAKSELLLYAGETLIELSTEGDARGPVLERAGRRYLEQARTELEASDATGRRLRDLTARIDVLSEDEVAASQAERVLVASLDDPDERTPNALSALAGYYGRRGEWDKAARTIRRLKDSSYLLWLRSLRRFVNQGGPSDTALTLIGEPETGGNPLLALLRARVLLAGSPEDKEAARTLLLAIVDERPDERSLLLEAYQLLREGGFQEAGLEVLERVTDLGPDVRTEALLAGGLAASPEGRERALAMIRDLSGRAGTAREILSVVATLRASDEAALRAYLEAPIEGAGDEAAHRRLARAAATATLFNTQREAEDADLLRDAALRDLQALRDAPLAKEDLFQAWPLALLLGDLESAGHFVARAIQTEGEPYNAAFLAYVLGRNTDAAESRARFVAGLGDTDAGRSAAFLAALGGAIREQTPAEDALASLPAIEAGGPPYLESLFFTARLAHLTEDRELEEASLRRVLEVAPADPEARSHLGFLLLAQQRHDEILEIQGDHEDVLGMQQRVYALWDLDRRDEARALAYRARDLHPDRPEPYLTLANLHLRTLPEEGAAEGSAADAGKEKALAVLSLAPQSRNVVMLRARLLTDKGEWMAAETLYAVLGKRHPKDMAVWGGLARTLDHQGRAGEMARILEQVLAQPDLDATTRGQAHLLKGTMHESAGAPGQAIDEYEAVLADLPDNAIALNNAAYLIAVHVPGRLAQAATYVEQVLERFPDQPNILDTAATVRKAQGQLDDALALLERAIAGKEKPSYLLRRADLLQALDRDDEAKAQLEALRATFPESEEGREAASRLQGR